MKRMRIVNKVSAWVLAVCFLLYVISGFDIQLRFLSPQLSSILHLKYVFIVAQLAFMIHTSYSLYFTLKRRTWWPIVGKGLLGLYLSLNLSLFVLFGIIHG